MATALIIWERGDAPTIELEQHHAEEASLFRVDQRITLSWGEPERLSSDPPLRTHLDIDLQRRELSLQVDRFGLFPAVVKGDAHGIVIASDLGTLLAHAPDLANRIRADALVDLLAFGQLFDTDTPWPELLHLPGGSHCRWVYGQGLSVELPTPLTLPFDPTSPQQGLDHLVNAVDERLKRMPEAMIPLSGGLDSRLLLGCAVAAGHKPETFCYGDPDSADRRVAAALATAVGCRHLTGEIALSSDSAGIARVANCGGGEVPIHHGHALLADLPASHGRPVLTGTGSESFRSFYYDRGLPGMSLLACRWARPRLRERAIRWALEHMSGGRLAGMDERYAASHRAPLKARIGAHLDAAPDLARGLDAVYLSIRVGRFVVAGQQLLNSLHPRLHPFLDPRVVTALSGLPAGWKLSARFHRWAIGRLSPALAAVEWDRTGRPLSQGLRFEERWPGLAAKLGITGRYAKAGPPLANYRPWAESVDRAALITRILERTTLPEVDRRLLEQWLSGLDPLHVIGALSALDRAAAPATHQ